MTDKSLDWLMADLVERSTGVRHAVLLSADGLLMAQSGDLHQEEAEHLAAVGSAYRSLSTGTGQRFGLGGVRQTVVELEYAFLLVTEAGPQASLALIVNADADLGLVAFETNRVVQQAGTHLTSRLRATAPLGAR